MISVQVRVLLIVFSFITAFVILRKIRKSSCKISESLFWVGLSCLFIIMGCLPQIPIMFAEWLGIESPVNFVYLIVIFLLLIKVFDLSIKLSVAMYKLEQLARHIAIQEVQDGKKCCKD